MSLSFQDLKNLRIEEDDAAGPSFHADLFHPEKQAEVHCRIPLSKVFGVQDGRIVSGRDFHLLARNLRLEGQILHLEVYNGALDDWVATTVDLSEHVHLHGDHLVAVHTGDKIGYSLASDSSLAVEAFSGKAESALSRQQSYAAARSASHEFRSESRSVGSSHANGHIHAEHHHQRSEREANLEEESSVYHRKMAELLQSIHIREVQLAEDRKFIADLHAQIAERDRQMKDMSYEYSQAQEELSIAHMKIATLERQNLEWDLKSMQSSNEQSEVFNANESLTTELTSARESYTKSEVEVATLTASLAVLEASHVRIEQENTELRLKISSFSSEVFKLTRDLREIRADYERSVTIIEERETYIRSLESIRINLTITVERLTAELTSREELYAALSEEATRTRTELTSVHAQLRESRMIIQQLKVHITTVETHVETLKQKIESQVQMASSSKEEVRVREEELRITREKLMSSTMELEIVRKTLKTEKLRVKSLSERLCRLRDSLTIHLEEVTMIERDLTTEWNMKRMYSYTHEHRLRGSPTLSRAESTITAGELVVSDLVSGSASREVVASSESLVNVGSSAESQEGTAILVEVPVEVVPETHGSHHGHHGNHHHHHGGRLHEQISSETTAVEAEMAASAEAVATGAEKTVEVIAEEIAEGGDSMSIGSDADSKQEKGDSALKTLFRGDKKKKNRSSGVAAA